MSDSISIKTNQTKIPNQPADADLSNKALLEISHKDIEKTLKDLETNKDGLSSQEAESRLKKYGNNEIAAEIKHSALMRLLINIKNPLVILLSVIGIVSFLTGDLRATVVIFIMVILGVVLRFFQELRADNSAEKLRAMVHTTSSVLRDTKLIELPISTLVPGDIIHLGAGDIVPADVRIIVAKDLFVNQSSLTGESLPLEKRSVNSDTKIVNPLEMDIFCFLGSSVVSGTASAVVLRTGDRTSLGSLALNIVNQNPPTSFEKGVNKFTWLMICFIGVMVPLVFIVSGLSNHSWIDAFMFSLAVAVGLTPEMLPMIVTVNLSKGALAMARKKVIVKRLDAIQNFGAADVLCTDKTGTLTQGKIILEKHLDVNGQDSTKVLHYGYMNSYFQTGLKNITDLAVLDHHRLEEELEIKTNYRKIDEIPFDFVRRRMSVIVEDHNNQHILICKGAVEEVLKISPKVESDGQILDVQEKKDADRKQLAQELNAQGFRVIAIGYKTIPGDNDEPHYSIKDESDLILIGFLAFLDPPKESATEALEKLKNLNVDVKVLTGDNEIVTRYICEKVGMPSDQILLGSEIESMNENQLSEATEKVSIFAKLAPIQKEKIIKALQSKGHVVAFMGDGINDAPALKAADVGISVDSAVDIAKESSDIILLENSLLVLEQGVLEGRKVFGNILKYIKMAASSNFGNMFSVVGASALLPFIPMLPIQVLTNNLLYDLSQTTIPTDGVDDDWLKKPRKWTISGLLRFILYFGPISSIFDYATFFLMLYVFEAKNNAALFHTGWFIESLFTQTLIIHIIRTNKIPLIESRASWSLIISSVLVVAVGAWLTISPFAAALGFVSLPGTYWAALTGLMIGYILITQLMKSWFYRRYPD